MLAALAVELAFVDSNILVYAVDRREPAKRLRALQLLAPTPGRELACSSQVLGEFFFAVTRKLGMSPADARDGVRRFQPLSRTAVDDELVHHAVALCVERPISYWDAVIVAAAARLHCEILLTEDLNDGELIAGVRVVDPFRAETQP